MISDCIIWNNYNLKDSRRIFPNALSWLRKIFFHRSSITISPNLCGFHNFFLNQLMINRHKIGNIIVVHTILITIQRMVLLLLWHSKAMKITKSLIFLYARREESLKSCLWIMRIEFDWKLDEITLMSYSKVEKRAESETKELL